MGIIRMISLRYANSRYFYETRFLGKNSLVAVYLGGLTAGASLAIISLPTSIVKVQQQMSSSGLSMIDTAKRIKQVQGIKGLYRGLVPHLFQAGIYFFNYKISNIHVSNKNVTRVFSYLPTYHDFTSETFNFCPVKSPCSWCVWAPKLLVMPLKVL